MLPAAQMQIDEVDGRLNKLSEIMLLFPCLRWQTRLCQQIVPVWVSAVRQWSICLCSMSGGRVCNWRQLVRCLLLCRLCHIDKDQRTNTDAQTIGKKRKRIVRQNNTSSALWGQANRGRLQGLLRYWRAVGQVCLLQPCHMKTDSLRLPKQFSWQTRKGFSLILWMASSSSKPLQMVLSTGPKLFAITVDVNWIVTRVRWLVNITCQQNTWLMQRSPLPLTKGRPSLAICNRDTWTTPSTARLDTVTMCEIIFSRCECYT